ncbi:hypothetical protein SDRG_00319 [Saprolegnia diclina VS20]|uniref:Uncharacterized protein n=1 Tax=Saprolegnia diclina (strain VS20) TaxID=1156394 RepID=T0R7Z6_SAPDV|nr:hypothetical protein SDRG_00319 [Saprolegnia diclina VS20]EQC42590.1 hypothetical protein SDRG_00319 [Saprolegnia diclina VS20]|eukprot:XP_008604013.1 hypothetical protein SDRG_00319 [Saprolegnia diclina VS20]
MIPAVLYRLDQCAKNYKRQDEFVARFLTVEANVLGSEWIAPSDVVGNTRMDAANDDPVCVGQSRSSQSFKYTKDEFWNKTAAVPAGANP